MFTDLPYEIIYQLYDYLEYGDVMSFFKSFNKELYSKAVQYKKKYIFKVQLYPLEIVNSKLFSTKYFKLTAGYENEDLKLLKSIDHKHAIIHSDKYNKNINFNDYAPSVYKIIFSEKYKSIFLRSKLNFQNIHVEFYTYDYIYD